VDERPILLVLRLWFRPEGFRAEVEPLLGGERHVLRGREELLRYLESLERRAAGKDGGE
jgi:hypothetical protein